MSLLGFVALIALLQFKVFEKIEQDYQKSTSQFLYAPAPELSSVSNVYLDGTQGAKALLAELTDLISVLKKKSPEEIFVVIDPKELKACAHLSTAFSGVKFVFKNSDVHKDCFAKFRKNDIGFLSLSEFTVDLGKGEHIYVKSAASEIYEQFTRVSQHSDTMNMALAFSRIPQIDGREILKSGTQKIRSHGEHLVNLKGKTVFVGFNTSTVHEDMVVQAQPWTRSSHKPYTLKSEILSEDFKLSNLFFHLKEDAFLKATTKHIQYALWALIYLQVLFSVMYFGPLLSALCISAVGLEVLALTVLFPAVLNLNVPMSYGLLSIVYTVIFAQALKRHEQEKVIRRTQKLLNARSLFNNQILDHKQSLRKNAASSVVDDTMDFNKYLTQIDVVDSVHGVVIPDISNEENPQARAKQIEPSYTPPLSKPQAQHVQKAIPNTRQPQSAEVKSISDRIKPETQAEAQKQTSAFKNIFTNVDVKKENMGPSFKLNLKSTSPKETKHKPAQPMNVKKEGNGSQSANTPSQPQFKILKDTAPRPFPKMMIERRAERPPMMVQNFQSLFTNNLRRKDIKFKVIGTPRAAQVEVQKTDSKKRDLFFEALCIQIINDSVEGSEIQFSSHDKDAYTVYVLTYKSQKQFNYKEWLKNAAFFEGLASELRLQGVIIYQNFDLSSDFHDLAIGFKKDQSQAFKVA